MASKGGGTGLDRISVLAEYPTVALVIHFDRVSVFDDGFVSILSFFITGGGVGRSLAGRPK